MFHSDEFGTDDDDEEFLAAATQVEAAQHDDFAASPRPHKRRKVALPPWQPFKHASDADRNATSARGSKTRINTATASIAAFDQENIAERDPDYYFPGELNGDQGNRSSKHRIHIPRNVATIPPVIVDSTQHGLDSCPTRIRGAVWKRPSPVCASQGTTDSVRTATQRTAASPRLRNAAKDLGNYFQPLAKPATVGVTSRHSTLAAQARVVGDEEDAAIEQQQQSSATQHMVGRDSNHPVIVDEDLADLPSDAFSSSLGRRSPQKDLTLRSSHSDLSRAQSSDSRRPARELKQMTIFGKTATQGLASTQTAPTRRSWPLKSRDEAPTHHKLDDNAMLTWVYPTNLGAVRDYQYNIVARSLFHNTLVALPTGLGKTFIAATVMLNYYRWTTDAQLIFMAPTKPLIAQQMEACYQIVGIPRGETVLMTGETSPAHRAAEWLEKRIFFMTPQTVINDLKTGICDPKKIVLLVVDEAHKATGGYAYTEVATFLRRFNSSFRVLALTATPGSSVETVQAVIDNLGIARVELRTEQSLDIRQYTHEKQTETEVFEFSDEQGQIMELLSKALRPTVEKLRGQNAYWSKDPMQLTAYGLTLARQKWATSDAGRRAPMAIKGMVNAAMTVLSSLAHSISLLKFHGIVPFYSGLLAFQKTLDSGQAKGKTATQIGRSSDFVNVMSMVRNWTNNPDFLGHPKLEYLRSVVLNHFLDAGEGRRGDDVPPSATRVMVFVNYRDSAEDICRALKRNEPMIRPHVFVGQAASKGSEGMDQKRQNAVIQDFKTGKFNTLVATSIGEEGLDIGTVDLIVCYDASSSPIRMLQRIGRTGRKRIGRVVLLLMKGKEENDYAKAQDNYSWIQKTIADETRYTYCDDQNPRILPKNIQPAVEKRIIEIPVENTQPIDLDEKRRKGRGKAKVKRPPKKFHMPDGVQIGFVNASKLGSEDADEAADHTENVVPKQKPATTRKRKASKPPQPVEPEAVQLPYLNDVLLTNAQRIELEHKYAQTLDMDAELLIRAPDVNKHSDCLRTLCKTRLVDHGRTATTVAQTLEMIHQIDDIAIDRMKASFAAETLRHNSISMQLLVANDESSKPAADPASESPLQGDGTRANRHYETANKPKAKKRQSIPKTSRVRARSAQRPSLQRVHSYGSAAREGDESSPEPTPADMRIATQGIDLGSRDTSGEDEDEEELDSELEAFIAKSSDPIEMASSSQPTVMSSVRKRRPSTTKGHGEASTVSQIFSSSVGEESDSGHRAITDSGNVKRTRQRRVIQDSDSDSDI